MEKKTRKSGGGGGKGKKRKMFVQIWHRFEMIVLDFYMERRVYARASDIISNLSKANLDLSVHLKRRSNVATLNNVTAYYRDDHSALPISGSMPILSLRDLKIPTGQQMDVNEYYVYVQVASISYSEFHSCTKSTAVYVHIWTG